jgi:membrane-bound lytic murein transglycosylase A
MTKVLTPVGFDQISGWHQHDFALSLQCFQRSAREIITSGSGFRRLAIFGGNKDDWLPACHAALKTETPKNFFESHFRAFNVTDHNRPEGLFTGYYEPLVQGSLTESPAYPVPVYAKPNDLVAFTAAETEATGLTYGRRIDGQAVAYDTRETIEKGALLGKVEVICWLSDWVDAFFMHVQGQGRVALANGEFIRLSYAGKAGHPYTGIGHVLVERGVAPVEKMSMQVLRDWMQQNPGEARTLMWLNKSYIFFQKAEVADNRLGGVGAAKVNLTPGCSLAVDRSFWMFGTPLWIETHQPPDATAGPVPIRQLMVAQDTGSAIKGVIRGDFFWGWGEEAAHIAGHMKSPGTMTALLPLPLARRTGHGP